MLNKFRVKNLRSLKDTGHIDIAPITLLLGENSSGKSTFLRAFPLLKQSAEVSTRSSVLWFGRYVDFGDFDQALIRDKGAKEITFSFSVAAPESIYHQHLRFQRITRNRGETDVVIDLRLSSLGKDGLTKTAGLDLNLDGNTVSITIGDANKISSILVNGTDYSFYSDLYSYSSAMRLLPGIHCTIAERVKGRFSGSVWWEQLAPQRVLDDQVSILKKYAHGKTSDDTLYRLAMGAGIGSRSYMLSGFKKLHDSETWKARTADLEEDNADVRRFSELTFLSKLSLIITNLDELLDNSFKRVSYIEPIRASAQRYYRSQDVSVKELDSKGENLAMFLRNLSERGQRELDKWTMEEFGFRIVVSPSAGHVNLGVSFDESSKAYNLADMGFGFSQVIPIIVQLWTILNNKPRTSFARFPFICLIEQPELHLHPRMQAKLATLLAQTVLKARREEIDMRLVIETHSEVVINKIGLLIASKKISNDLVNIVLFSKADAAAQSVVSVSRYGKDGTLQDWPYGFFDFEV